MNTHLQAASPGVRADTLLVFLPGAFLKLEDFEREGFVSAVRERNLAADVTVSYTHLTLPTNREV